MKDINLIQTKDSIFLKKITSKNDLIKNDSCDGYLLQTSESEARRIIESVKEENKIIGLVGKDDVFNRRAIETLKINYLISPELEEKLDTLKQRNSGLNHVVAKIAAKKKITIVINASEISKLKGKEKAIRLEKIIQNIKICKKASCEIKIASLANNKSEIFDKKARVSIGLSLGMSSAQSSNSTKFN